MKLTAGVAAFVVAFGLAGYAWRGNHEGWGIGPGEGVAAAPADPASAQRAQFETLVGKLEERLKQRPDDAQGWSMLGRAYTALGRYADAPPAFRKAVALRPQDAQALADLADSLAMANDRSLAGEPEQLVLQAVKLDPGNVKALALAGTVAFNRDDFKTAAAYWAKGAQAAEASEPGSELARQLQVAASEASQRAGLPAPAAPQAVPARPPAPASPGAAATATPPGAASTSTPGAVAAAASASITGRITLAAALRAQVAPGDTVFVFARPAAGSRMPLAIQRRQAGELPFEFTLDDSMAMSPAARLSSTPQVIVGARISKSGNAMPQPGDLQVLSPPVAVGTRGLQLEIAEPVR